MAMVDQDVLPLTAGDVLSRAEFLRRWEMHPGIKKAELIGGVVYMPSPVAADHADTDGDVGTWLGVYQAHTPGCKKGHNATAYLLDDAPQADSNLRLEPECGGASWIEDGYLAGAPELFAEICRSSVNYDLHQKKDLYEAAGVREYLAVLLHEQEIRWHQLVDGRYGLIPADTDGVWRSRVFPGLWLDGAALLAGNVQQLLAVLDRGLKTPEHAAFVAELVRRKQSHTS